MANIMNMKRIQNRVSRNGFDLSTKRNFTAKVGELLPVLCQEVLPGDKFQIDLKAMTRTVPINTAAFARIREYYDFFYVPYNLLWNKANTVLSKMDYNTQHAVSIVRDENGPLEGELPYTDMKTIYDYLNGFRDSSTNEYVKNNYFGFDRCTLSLKLLEYLGYGTFYQGFEGDGPYLANPVMPPYNMQVNVLPLLAYQKIYSDFYRDEQWEKPDPTTFNCDYISGNTSGSNTNEFPVQLSTDDDFYTNYNLFDLRYCNWPKDLYHGLLPAAQYGDEAMVPLAPIGNIDGDLALLGVNKKWNSVDGMQLSAPIGIKNDENVSNPIVQSSIYNSGGTIERQLLTFDKDKNYQIVAVNPENFPSTVGGLSILALRQYEFLQKWKEIAQSGDQNYKDMTKRIWNVDVSEHLAERVRYLGGVSSSIDINEVVNTNITGENAADIAGKGVGVQNGKISFESDGQYGFIVCIYHALPLADYTCSYTNPSVLRVNAEDFANPVFDKVGMEQVTSVSIYNENPDAGRPLPDPQTPFSMGYAPRYIDYKTGIDLTFGGFKFGNLRSWVVQYGKMEIMDALSLGESISVSGDIPNPSEGVDNVLNYTFFKINPKLLDSIMSVQADSTVLTDQLLVSSFFDIKEVRNLDVDGLPY